MLYRDSRRKEYEHGAVLTLCDCPYVKAGVPQKECHIDNDAEGFASVAQETDLILSKSDLLPLTEDERPPLDALVATQFFYQGPFACASYVCLSGQKGVFATAHGFDELGLPILGGRICLSQSTRAVDQLFAIVGLRTNFTQLLGDKYRQVYIGKSYYDGLGLVNGQPVYPQHPEERTDGCFESLEEAIKAISEIRERLAQVDINELKVFLQGPWCKAYPK